MTSPSYPPARRGPQPSQASEVPVLANDHQGVAPAVIGVVGLDPICDQGLAYADA
ncbi:hypothetical protein [Streptomyces violascens]|uniref:Uncharacterized protein n=1 Tax=Streptomyces violascens TaxID=67381 RepID=A0ABQ3QSE5_9ACTN|nr:hypothetical protein [Streptomyces violascens]GGU50552.1 hypothetical protein GCM10010289_83720 [Streptomyces violascens]GHI40193.1 hypothetical protein Sviol_46010 [Streptomyces violascens]